MARIGSYSIIQKINSNDRRTIYRALNATEIPVVLKVLHQVGYMHSDGARIRREFNIASRLSPQYVVTAIEQGVIDGMPYLACEDFNGLSLQRFMEQKPLALEEFIDVAIKMTSCVIHAHSMGIVHRDVNPSNFIVTPDLNIVKLNDFGIAEEINHLRGLELSQHKVLNHGTIHYMAPEQTGRVDYAIDYRTDLYSLGISFFEMLTGSIPFATQGEDFIEGVHMHLSMVPRPVNSINPLIPKTLSDIVAKLVEKNPENRYQSAYGLKADLIKLKMLLDRHASIIFEIGQKDVPSIFAPPQKLYGRQEQLRQILDKSQAALLGQRQFILLRGQAGIGKRFILNKAIQAVQELGAGVLLVNCDLTGYSQAYAGFNSAIANWVKGVLANESCDLEELKTRLLTDVGPQLSQLNQVFPHLEKITGPLVSDALINPVEARMRFNQAFIRLLNVVRGEAAWLVIGIEELDKADDSTLKLLQYTLAVTESMPILFIATSELNRQNLGATALFSELLTDVSVHQMTIEGMSIENTTAYFSDVFKFDMAECHTLAEIAFDKTKGNPSALHQFASQCCDQGVLSFDYEIGRWNYNLEQYRKMPASRVVIDNLMDRYDHLNADHQHFLQLAAIFPLRFEAKRLFDVLEWPHEDFYEALKLGVDLGFLQTDIELSAIQYGGLLGEANMEIAFEHAAIRPRLLAQMPKDQRQIYLLRIGMALYDDWHERGETPYLDEMLFNLNESVGKIEDITVLHSLALFNLKKAKNAKQAAAYDIALQYSELAVRALAGHQELVEDALYFDACLMEAELLYLNRKHDQAERAFDSLKLRARDAMDMVQINRIRLVLFVSLGETHRVVDLASDTLKLLEFPLSERFSELLLVKQLIELQFSSEIRNPSHILELPKATHEKAALALEVLNQLISVSYLISKALFMRIILKMIALSQQYGAMRLTPFAYATYGIVECALFKRYGRAFNFGLTALEAAKKTADLETLSKVNFTIGFFLSHWVKPIRSSIPYLEEGRDQSYSSGNMVYFAYNTAGIFLARVATSANMLELNKDVIQELKNPDILTDRDVSNLLVAVLQYTRAQSLKPLEKLANKQPSLADENFDDEAFERELRLSNMPSILAHYLILKMKLYYTLGYYDLVTGLVTEVKPLLGELMGLYIGIEYQYYSALAQSYNVVCNPWTQGQIVSGSLVEAKKYLKQLSKKNPENFMHKYEHVQARLFWMGNRLTEAHLAFISAIRNAHEHGFYLEEAFICEDLASLYQAMGQEKLSRIYLQEAYLMYRQIDCTVKCHLMVQQYPDIALERLERLLTAPNSSRTTFSQGTQELDSLYIMKSSQALAAALDERRLAELTLTLLLEVSGAQKAVLVLKGQNLGIRAHLKNGVFEWLDDLEPVRGSLLVPVGMVQYVNRTNEPLLSGNALEDDLLKGDVYVRAAQLKSALCVPINHKGGMVGLVYLENNLIQRAFSADRIEILQLVLSHYAIAYENAKLYSELESSRAALILHQDNLGDMVRERTYELSKTKMAIETLLNQVGQGFLSINEHGRVNPAFSRACLTIFQHDIADEAFDELLANHVSNLDQAFLRNVILKVFEVDDSDRSEIFLSLLPAELVIRSRMIQAQYRYVRHQYAKQITVILTDITDKVTLEREFEEERRLLRMVVNVVRYQNSVKNSIKRLRTFFDQDCTDILKDRDINISLQELYRVVHTFKGDFAQWQMAGTARVLHQIEDDLARFVTSEWALTAKTLADYMEDVSVDAILQEDLNQLERYLGSDFLEGKPVYQIGADDLAKLQGVIEKSVPLELRSQVLKELARVKWIDIDEVISQYSEYVQHLAISFDKGIKPVVRTGDSLKLDEERYANLLKALVHIFRNAVQYGIETLADREVLEKEREGTLRVHIHHDIHHFKLIVEDDGAGLDMDRIDALLGQKMPEWLGKPLVERQQAIFEYGLSTSDETSELSGRGVGLSALKEAVEELGGSIVVESEPEMFTRFILEVPILLN